MTQPYIGEIRMFGGNFPPLGWEFCQGQLLPIATNDVLFQLIGTTYGGDGQSTFALPDLRGRVPVHAGTRSGRTYNLSEAAGVETVTLTVQQLPAHSHALLASDVLGTTPNPGGEVLTESSTATMFATGSPTSTMAPASVGPAGGSQPHENRQPFLCIDFIIATEGIFPSQT
jgi:microcystin-dependent protein